MKYLSWEACLGGGLVLVSLMVHAAPSNTTLNVTIKVNVVAAPSCTINGGNDIVVNFGDIPTALVDGGNFMQNIDYKLVCGTPGGMKIKVLGNPAGYSASALETSIADFGIALRFDGQPLVINDWINFTYPANPLLLAVPVKKPGVTLPGGAFNAGATLVMDYQ